MAKKSWENSTDFWKRAVLLVLATMALMVAPACSHDHPAAHKVLLEDQEISLIEVDGCEYVLYHSGAGRAIVHHGNCHNPAHSTPKTAM